MFIIYVRKLPTFDFNLNIVGGRDTEKTFPTYVCQQNSTEQTTIP